MTLQYIDPESDEHPLAVAQAERWLGYSLAAPGIRRAFRVWAVRAQGENWDEVAEAFQSRPIKGLLVNWAGASFREGLLCSIAVAPEHRGQGLGTKLLRWTLLNQCNDFNARVRCDNSAGLAFASRHGTLVSAEEPAFLFNITRETARLPHPGCPCSECWGELISPGDRGRDFF